MSYNNDCWACFDSGGLRRAWVSGCGRSATWLCRFGLFRTVVLWVSGNPVWRINGDVGLGLDLQQWQAVYGGHRRIFGWSCFGLDTNGCLKFFYFFFANDSRRRRILNTKSKKK